MPKNRLSPQDRKRAGQKGGQTTLQRYGRDYLVKLSKHANTHRSKLIAIGRTTEEDADE